MSKIICEVCGTAYPETTEQCPICGCVRSGEPVVLVDNMPESGNSNVKTYSHVKGGRFSKANVKKRNLAAPVYTAPETEEFPVEAEDAEEEKSEVAETAEPEKKSALDVWLTVAIVVLLLSIVAVVIYIALNFFNIEMPQFTKPSETTSPTTTAAAEPSTAPTTAPTTEPTEPQDIACEALHIASSVVKLDKVGAASLLNIEVIPANCTEVITYASADESVATVTESGKIVAVGNGSTIITATCGTVKLECTVNVAVEDTEPTTAPTTEPTTPPTTKPAGVELNREDFSLLFKGDSWVLYDGPIPNSEIKWSSRDERVVTVNNGKVVAVGPGYTWVYAEYNGVKTECIVHCNFAEETTETPTNPTEPSQPTEPENGGNTGSQTYSISHTDVTIKIGESFTLQLMNASGEAVTVSWRASNTSVCSVSGSTVTGLAVGDTKVYVPYEGREYACIVRVKKS